MRVRARITLVSIVLTAALLLNLFPPFINHTRAASTGLQNPGFEDGLTGWTISTPVADNVTVVGTDTATQWPAYTAMKVTSVSPFKGTKMLRLGTPKGVSESQNQGTNTVIQSFTANANTFRFTFRAFSWEFRSYDKIRIDVKDASGKTLNLPVTNDSGSPLTILMPSGTSKTYPSTPIEVIPDVGKRGNYMAMDWLKVRIGGLTAGQTYSITYSVVTGNNNAHATWAYFDNVNNPPVSKFSFSPNNPAEGGLIHFNDLSYDPDPGDAVVSWLWRITYPGGNTTTSTLQNPSFLPSDEGTYQVSLTVGDKDGATNTVTSGGTATDGGLVPAAVVFNAPPVVNALNIEVRYGDNVYLFGRFIDTGWTDTHLATWNIPGFTVISDFIVEKHKAVVDKGTVFGFINGANLTAYLGSNPTLPITLNGSLTITDNETLRSSGTASFTITVVADNVTYREENGALFTAPRLNSDGVYVSYIQSAGDIDIFEVKLPDGSLPAGTKVLVNLKDLPADYDLALVTQPPAGSAQTADFDIGDFDIGDFDIGDFDIGDFDIGDFDIGDFDIGDFDIGDFDIGDFDIGDFDIG
ncbi:MAG: hypothetical protein HY663_01510, partial [Chloroflexi bacterium]|nr:hypothetical protein [Chloroflexota bacterium]